MMLFAITIVVAVAIAAALLLRRSRGSIVIGRQLAEAHARDLQHRKQFGHMPSPFPRRTYDAAKGDYSLIDPQPNDIDRELRSLCRKFSSLSAAERQQFRNAATTEDFYTLFNFAGRASVFALRERDATWVQDGLSAAAIVDLARIDERDLPLGLSLLHHAAERLHLPVEKVFDGSASLAEPQAAKVITGFVREPPEVKNIEASWGYQEIISPVGVGFAQRDFEEFRPTKDLLSVALAIRDSIRRDHYEADVTLATDLPEVWFPPNNRRDAAEIVRRVLGTVSVHATMRSGVTERADAQNLLVFVTETTSPEDASALERLAVDPSLQRVALVARSGSLFLIAIAQSSEVGVPAYETHASANRFALPFADALRSAAG
jgi:hypothetical protein